MDTTQNLGEDTPKRDLPAHIKSAMGLAREGLVAEAVKTIIEAERDNLPEGHGGKGLSGAVQGEIVSEFLQFESYQEYIKDSIEFTSLMMSVEDKPDILYRGVIAYFSKERQHDIAYFTKKLKEFMNNNPSDEASE